MCFVQKVTIKNIYISKGIHFLNFSTCVYPLFSRELDLSCNQIVRIEGIEMVPSLMKLNLAGNLISKLPT